MAHPGPRSPPTRSAAPCGSSPPTGSPPPAPRALRIVPAYWLALTVLALAPGLPDVFTGRWWVYYGLLQAYDPSWFDKGIVNAWSLSTEVAFYALLPVYAWVAPRVARGVRTELALLALLAGASMVAR